MYLILAVKSTIVAIIKVLRMPVFLCYDDNISCFRSLEKCLIYSRYHRFGKCCDMLEISQLWQNYKYHIFQVKQNAFSIITPSSFSFFFLKTKILCIHNRRLKTEIRNRYCVVFCSIVNKL